MIAKYSGILLTCVNYINNGGVIMKNFFTFAVVSTFLFVSLFGCSKADTENVPVETPKKVEASAATTNTVKQSKVYNDKNILAAVGDTVITVEEFNERVAVLPEQYRKLATERKKEYVNELVNDVLLYNEALRLNVDQQPEAQKLLTEAKKKIFITWMLNNAVDKKIKVSDSEVKKFYKQNKDKYKASETMRASHILVPTKDQAEDIIAILSMGEAFDTLAKAKSVDPSAQQGGDIGYFQKGQLLPEFEAACEQLKTDGISAPVQTKLGYHVIKLTDRKPAEQKSFDEVKEDAKMRLQMQERQKIFNKMITRLRKENKIYLNEKALTSK